MGMDSFQLVVPQLVLDAVIEHAKAELPNECVGFLAGRLSTGFMERFMPDKKDKAKNRGALAESA